MSQQVVIIGEVGINHNSDMNIIKDLIYGCKGVGCSLIKFQKRTIDIVYSKEELDKPRESPFGTTTRQQKEGLELGKKEYNKIDKLCKEVGIDWFASSWDTESQLFLRQYDLKYNKIASAMLTDLELLKMVASEKKYTFISTGMSTMEQVEQAVEIFRNAECPFELMHTCSTYPMKNQNANLLVIKTLQEKFGCPVGYSGHENGRVVSLAAVALGASSIERHITLDKTLYGSDQAASLELAEFGRLISDIRTVEVALGSPEKKLLDVEIPVMKKLRRVG